MEDLCGKCEVYAAFAEVALALFCVELDLVGHGKGAPSPWRSIALWHAQLAFGDVAQGQLLADRCQTGDHDFAQHALHVVFLGIAHAAVGEHGALRRLKAELGREIFRGVGFAPQFSPVS